MEREFLRFCGVLDKWHKVTIKDFVNDKDTKNKVIKYLDNYSDFRKDGVGIYFYGANGVGKSMLLNIMFKKFIEKRKRVRIRTMADIVTTMIKGWREDEFQEEFERMQTSYECLGIEEVGKEFRSQLVPDMKNSDVVITALDGLLRERVQRSLPTFFTSNLAPGAIGKMYSKDIASMLNESCLIIEVTGEDFRDIIADKNSKKL